MGRLYLCFGQTFLLAPFCTPSSEKQLKSFLIAGYERFLPHTNFTGYACLQLTMMHHKWCNTSSFQDHCPPGGAVINQRSGGRTQSVLTPPVGSCTQTCKKCGGYHSIGHFYSVQLIQQELKKLYEVEESWGIVKLCLTIRVTEILCSADLDARAEKRGR